MKSISILLFTLGCYCTWAGTVPFVDLNGDNKDESFVLIKTKTKATLVIQDGANKKKTWKLEFPIGTDTQDAFCGDEIEASVEDSDGKKILRLNDGMCDSIFVSWDFKQKKFRLDRN